VHVLPAAQSAEVQHAPIGMQLPATAQTFIPGMQAHTPPGPVHAVPGAVQSLDVQHEPAAMQLFVMEHTVCPAAHVGLIVHAPPMHAPLLHAVPHAPQFVGSEARFASHPSVHEPLQLAKPGLHTQPVPSHETVLGSPPPASPASANEVVTEPCPLGTKVSATLKGAFAVTLETTGLVTHVGAAIAMEGHATGKAAPTNVSVPTGSPLSGNVAPWFDVTGNTLVTVVPPPATAIWMHWTPDGTVISAAARPVFSTAHGSEEEQRVRPRPSAVVRRSIDE
jgi:hypothetical protein